MCCLQWSAQESTNSVSDLHVQIALGAHAVLITAGHTSYIDAKCLITKQSMQCSVEVCPWAKCKQGRNMIRLTEEIVSKQVVETTDILNLRKGAVNNMVDVRACNKPGARVSVVYLFKNLETWVLRKQACVVWTSRLLRCVKCGYLFVGLRQLCFCNVCSVLNSVKRNYTVHDE